MENCIEAQGSNQAHPATSAGMREFHDTVGLVAKHGDGDVRQPASHHLDHLACPLGDGLVSQPQALTDPRFHEDRLCGVGAGTLRKGKAQQRLVQGGVTTRVSTIQRSPLVLTQRLRLEASGSR